MNPLTSKRNNNDSDDKKAYPELLLKQQIAIIDRNKVISAFKTLEQNRKANPGRKIDCEDKVLFEAELAGLFLDIKDMIKSKTSNNMSDYEQKNYNNLILLVKGKENFVLAELISMMNYLLKMLHILNISNLLINQPDAFADWENEIL